MSDPPIPQSSDLPNPNFVPAEEDDNDDETLKNPGQEIEQKPNLFVDADEQQQQLQKQQDCEEIEQQADQEEEEEIEDEEGINMHHSPLPQSSTSKNTKNLTSNLRRNKKRKRNHVAKQRKIQALSKDFNPIPFVPDKSFDFSKHEESLRKLGLWDFAHLRFDTDLRDGLLVQLIAAFSPKCRAPYVNENRIKVSRADLARALKLPVKKPAFDCEGNNFSAEFISFLGEFVSSWMLLQEGDVCVMPNEIVNWMKPIREGQPQKVDWAGLIWFMVEKELAQGTKLGDCYYASHLQQLIKDQKPGLLAETVDLCLDNNKIVEEVMVEDDEEGGDTEMLNDLESSLGEEKLQDQCIQLGLDKKPNDEIVQKDGDDDGVERADDAVERADDANLVEVEGEAGKLKEIVDGIDEEKNESTDANMEPLCEGGEMGNIDNVECAENVNSSGEMSVDDTVHFGSERNWLNGVNDEGQHVMQRCSNMSGLKISNEDDGGCEDVEDEVGEDDEQGFNFMEESTPAMNGMSSRNLMQAIETGHLPYNTSVELGGQSSLGFLPSKAENDVMLDGTSLFDHVVKREIDHENDISHHALDENHKGMRFDGHWDHKPPDSVTCMDKLLQWAQKLKMVQETEREATYQQVNMAQMYSHEKENEVIQWRCKYDELQRKFHTEVGRRDRELHLMNNVIDGYRRALKDSQKAFSEYRKRCQLPDEPIYKDVGSGGVMKSIMELEKERIKKEEEDMRILNFYKHKAIEFKMEFDSQLQESNKKFMLLEERLKDAAKEVEVLRHRSSKRKISKNVSMSEEVQSESQELEKDDLMKHKMSGNVSMTEDNQSEEVQDIPKEDLVEPKLSEDVPMLEEGQAEPQEIPKDDVDEPMMSDYSVVPLPEEVPSEAQE